MTALTTWHRDEAAKLARTFPLSRKTVEDAEYRELQNADQQVTREIREVFARLRTVPADQLAVPVVIGAQEAAQKLSRAIPSLLAEGDCSGPILQALMHSNCPYVQVLREALCEEYVRQNAGDVAEMRA